MVVTKISGWLISGKVSAGMLRYANRPAINRITVNTLTVTRLFTAQVVRPNSGTSSKFCPAGRVSFSLFSMAYLALSVITFTDCPSRTVRAPLSTKVSPNANPDLISTCSPLFLPTSTARFSTKPIPSLTSFQTKT